MNASRKVFALIGAGLIALIALWTFQPSGAPIAGQERGELGKPGMMGGAVGYWQQLLQDEKGEIPPDGLMRARAQMAQMAASSAGGRGAGLAAAGLTRTSWIWLGPGNIGGAVTAIVFHPQFASNQTMWAGTAGGGIWKSTNGGASWSPVDDFLANLAVSDMLIDPTNANTIYASTGEQISGGATRGAGVFKSTDGGSNWSQLAATVDADNWAAVNALAISPNGATLLAANHTRYSNVNGAVYRSTDGGNT